MPLPVPATELKVRRREVRTEHPFQGKWLACLPHSWALQSDCRWRAVLYRPLQVINPTSKWSKFILCSHVGKYTFMSPGGPGLQVEFLLKALQMWWLGEDVNTAALGQPRLHLRVWPVPPPPWVHVSWPETRVSCSNHKNTHPVAPPWAPSPQPQEGSPRKEDERRDCSLRRPHHHSVGITQTQHLTPRTCAASRGHILWVQDRLPSWAKPSRPSFWIQGPGRGVSPDLAT